VVSAAAIARRVESQGADGVIAEGAESGGHIGELTTMALVPQVVSAVSIPVIAAGGIASGEQMLAAIALGACGVQIGTTLLRAEECPIHENYKTALLKAKDNDTVVTGRSVNAAVRILRNQMSIEYIKLEKAGASQEELEKFTLGSLRKAVFDGDVKNGSLMAGQVAGMLTDIKPAEVILRELYEDCVSAAKMISANPVLN
jgi:enoyl-[acyl-carrier protein] reductase II